MENQPSMSDQFLTLIDQIIEDNLDKEYFSVDDLAQKAGLSRSMLHRKLIKLTGKPASDFITEKRLIRAKELLENDVATASEIAYRVGFNSPSYFNKVFKKHFNVSPGDVRKGVRIDPSLFSKGLRPEDKVLARIKKQKLRNRVLVIVLIAIISMGGLFYFIKLYKPEEKSIAVLPLHNLTGQPENAYFVDGMHEALIGELGQIGSLRVISRTSTLRYRDSNMLLKDIANELGVNTIVEGSVQCAGDSLCFIIQLIDVFPKERHLLANEYYDGMHNVLTVQSSAAKDIAQKINLKLTKNEEQRLAKSRTVDPETYKAYLRGMYYLNQGTAESFEKGINYLQEAINRDPGDPFAYAGLALGYAIMGHGQVTPQEAFLRATSAANKAIKLDPDNDEAYTALALLYLYDAWNWPMAKEAFENALAKNPNNEIAHAHFAWYYVLFDDIEKSIYHGKQAVMIEPFSASYNSWLSLLYWYNKEYDEAEYWAKKALSINEAEQYGKLTLAYVYLHKKQFQQAVEYAEKLPDFNWYWKMLRGYIYVRAGQRERALKYYKDMIKYSKDHWVNYTNMGMMAAYLGFTDEAFEALNKSLDQKLYPLNYINFYDSSEDIRSDPRYDELLKKMNLPHKGTLITSNQ
jgi:TolB-like protein/AraC-like DNA-binding protein